MTEPVPPPILAEVSADSGKDIGSRYVNELRRSYDEVLNVHGGGNLSLYRKLLSDDQVRPTFHQLRSSIVAQETKVEPGGDAPIDGAAADFVKAQLARVSWDHTTYKMLSGLMFGYGVSECLFGVEAGRITLDGIRVRKPERFAWGVDNALRLLRNGAPIQLPERKFWTFSAGAEDDDDPYGLGLGHFLYWPTWFKRNVIKFWAQFLERFSMATPVAKIPAGSKEEERQELLELLDNVTGGGRIVIPAGVDLQLIQAAKDSGGDYERFITLLNGAISKIVVMQTMTTDQGASLSQAQVHERTGRVGAKSYSDLLTESFAQGPARWLVEWNFPGAAMPVIYRDFSDALDLTESAARDVQLNSIGYRPTAERIRDTYGDGYEYAPPSPAPSPMANFAEPRSASAAVDELMAGGEWRRVLGPEVGRLEALVEDAATLEEVRDRLGDLALRDPAELTTSLAQLLFAARVGGNVDYAADVGGDEE